MSSLRAVIGLYWTIVSFALVWIPLFDASMAAADSASLHLLEPPHQERPVRVHVAFELNDLTEINDSLESFEFSGFLTLRWKDPRQAFEPAAGQAERVYQGNYQFDEVFTGWFPQVVLVNESGTYQTSAVLLRIQPDGSSTLTESVMATAETNLDMRKYPFDRHRLEAVFAVLGFDRDEVVLETDESIEDGLLDAFAQIPQWTIEGTSRSIRDRVTSSLGQHAESSTFVVGIDVERKSFYIRRLVTFPLAAIVLLSFSVFWMDRSSLGDRVSVSFIGILTGVAYQLLMADVLPRISYFTMIHAFLFLSFMTMSATVVVNLVVGAMDNRGRQELGDRIDRRCRWIFPLVYFGLVYLMLVFADVAF